MLEPDCDHCLDVGEIYIIFSEATGDGYWMLCPHGDAVYDALTAEGEV